MAIISGFSSGFEGTNGTTVTVGSFNIDSIFGSASSAAATISTAWSPVGLSSLRINTPAGTGNDKILNLDDANTSTQIWADFYLKVVKAPNYGQLTTAIFQAYNTTPSTHLMDLTIEGSASPGFFILKLRNAGFSATGTNGYISPDLVVGKEYRIAIHVEPGVAASASPLGTRGLSMKIFSDGNLHTMTPSLTSPSSIVASGVGGTVIDQIKLGTSRGTDIGGIEYFMDDLIVDSTTQPVRSAGSTVISDWEEGFEAAPAGTLLGPTNSIFTRNQFGTDNGVIVADPYQNTKSVKFGPSSSYVTYLATTTERTDVFLKFALKVESLETGLSTNIVELTNTAGLPAANINLDQQGTDYVLRLRSGTSGTTTLYSLGAIPFSEWIEVGLEYHLTGLDTGTMRLSYWADTDRGQVSATAAGALSAIVGSTGITSVDTLKIGPKTGIAHEINLDSFRADTASMPASLNPPGQGTSMTVSTNDINNVEPFSIFNLVASISGGAPPYTISWEQTSGGTILLTGADTLSATGEAPAYTVATSPQFTVTVTDSTTPTPLEDSAVATVNILQHDLFWRFGDNWRAIKPYSAIPGGGWDSL